jgi:hypothetical protein
MRLADDDNALALLESRTKARGYRLRGASETPNRYGLAGNRRVGNGEDQPGSVPSMVPIRRYACNWLAYLAGGGLVLTIWKQLKREHPKPTGEGTRGAQENKETAKPKPLSHRYSNYDHPSEEEHRTAEQFNWRKGNTLNVLIAAGAIVAAIFAIGSFCESKRQADIAQKTLVQTTRAWLDISVDAKTISLDWPHGQDATFLLTVTATNKGNSPASYVFLHPQVFFDKRIIINAGENIVLNSCNIPFPGRMVFPTSSTDMTFEAILKKEEIQDAREIIAKANKKGVSDVNKLTVTLLACVSYRITGDTKLHHSGRLYLLGGMQDPWSMNIEESLPNGSVRLQERPSEEYSD